MSRLSNGNWICAICATNEGVLRAAVLKGALRFIRLLKIRPRYQLDEASLLCRACYRNLALMGIQALQEEDYSETLRLQDRALDELDRYEHKEPDWYKQFKHRRTIGQRIADTVAEVGGSWAFIISLCSFLLGWAMINLTSIQWDPYPFILLNLFLSTIAALQAPVIMMSQNRSAVIEREQAEYVGRFVLRAENSIRHVNAKMENLVNSQWRRLLEIQELQSALIISDSPVSAKEEGERGEVDIESDQHLMFLLRAHYRLLSYDDVLVFSHRHVDSDNFYASISNVELSRDNIGVRAVTYTLNFSDNEAVLDDLFMGSERHIALRDSFDLNHYDMQAGRVTMLSIQWLGDTHIDNYLVGKNLPVKYDATFRLQRSAAVTDFWKRPLSMVKVTYKTGEVFSAVAGGRDATACIDRGKNDDVCIWLRQNDETEEFYKECAEGNFSRWSLVLRHKWEEGEESTTATIRLPSSICILYCSDGRATIRL